MFSQLPTRPEYWADYRSSVAHLNGLTLASLRELQRATRGEAVVILMSDHGSRSTNGLDIDERHANLFAAYTPGGRLFGDVVSPVNVLPTLFNRYLGTTLPSWPDAIYEAPATGGYVEHPDPWGAP